MLDLSDLLRDWASKRKEFFDKEATLTDNLETMSAFHYLKRSGQNLNIFVQILVTGECNARGKN